MNGSVVLLAIALSQSHLASQQVILERSLGDGQRVVVLRDSIVEEGATDVERQENGWMHIRGGDLQTDVAAIILHQSPDSTTHRTIWLKMHFFSPGPAFGPAARRLRDELSDMNRLHIYDVSRDDENDILIAYSTAGRLHIDRLRQDAPDAWRVHRTIELFEQRHSEVHPRIVRSGRFVSLDDNLYIWFDMRQVEKAGELWIITKESASEVTTSELHERARDAAARADTVTVLPDVLLAPHEFQGGVRFIAQTETGAGRAMAMSSAARSFL
jgi:hypothetical protein